MPVADKRTTNAARGGRYKARSKKWLERQGKTVFDMEIQRINWTPNGAFPVKRDQLGSDIGYLDVEVVVFVQVKSGARSEAALTREAKQGFRPYQFPIHSRLELHIWRSGAGAPKVVVL